MTVPKPGEFGEPWDELWVDGETISIKSKDGSDRWMSQEDHDVIIQRVNAMNGRDHVKLVELEQVIEMTIEVLRWGGRNTRADALESAARAFGTIQPATESEPHK